MKNLLLLLILITLAATTAYAEEHKEIESLERLQAENELEIEEIHMERERLEANFEFEKNMQNLELLERKAKINQLEKRTGAIKKRHPGPCLVLFAMITIAVHILSAVWVYKDMQERKNQSGLWLAIILLGGLLALIPYSIIRLVEPAPTPQQ